MGVRRAGGVSNRNLQKRGYAVSTFLHADWVLARIGRQGNGECWPDNLPVEVAWWYQRRSSTIEVDELAPRNHSNTRHEGTKRRERVCNGFVGARNGRIE